MMLEVDNNRLPASDETKQIPNLENYVLSESSEYCADLL